MIDVTQLLKRMGTYMLPRNAKWKYNQEEKWNYQQTHIWVSTCMENFLRDCVKVLNELIFQN